MGHQDSNEIYVPNVTALRELIRSMEIMEAMGWTWADDKGVVTNDKQPLLISWDSANLYDPDNFTTAYRVWQWIDQIYDERCFAFSDFFIEIDEAKLYSNLPIKEWLKGWLDAVFNLVEAIKKQDQKVEEHVKATLWSSEEKQNVDV